MTLEGMTDEQLQERESRLLALVPPDGSGIGNTTLMHQLGWEESELYWQIRDRLLDRGVLALGRGRGGSVKLAQPKALPEAVSVARATPAASESSPLALVTRVSEDGLYEPVARVLREHWARDKRYDQSLVEIIARQGARATGGRWSRPDLVLASLTTYPYVPGKHFDVTTFEVKPHDTMDVTAIYEALAHLRTATRAYVLLWVPKDLVDSYKDM